MGRISLPEPELLIREERQRLLDLAGSAIEHAVRSDVLVVEPGRYTQALQRPAATFVTLRREGELRGCIGGLTVKQALVLDVVENAAGAALRDPRFFPLNASELIGLHIHISVLSSLTPLAFDSETELLAQLRPGVDGLLLELGARRGTFLPSVWDTLPEPRDFLRELKRKAGLPHDYWSLELRISRYTTESFS
jgi:AmmeMemoRadiSam system protein A